MNIKELPDQQIKALLYDLFMEKKLLKNNIKILQREITQREESKVSQKKSIETKKQEKDAS